MKAELISRFYVSSDVCFPTEEECRKGLLDVGINDDGADDYLTLKKHFGDSWIQTSPGVGFYVASPVLGADDDVWTLRGINAMWQDRLDFKISIERQWGKDEDKLIGLWQMKKYRPFFVNPEYDSWLFWKTDERRADGQFPVFIMDLANDPGGWDFCRDIFEIYEEIWAGEKRYSHEKPKRDGNGRVILWRMMLANMS